MSQEEFEVFLDQNVSFEGKLTFKGVARINGKFKGDIESSGTLVIGEGADVSGNVQASKLVILGKFEGEIKAESSVFMHPPAHFIGEVSTPVLKIEEGVIFEGSSKKA